MKCMLHKTFRELTPKARKDLINAFAVANQKVLEEQYEQIKLIMTNNLFKIFVVMCNEELGVGKSRMVKILDKINSEIKNMTDNDDDFFMRLEQQCKQILGEEKYKRYFSDIPFKALPQDYNFLESEEYNK